MLPLLSVLSLWSLASVTRLVCSFISQIAKTLGVLCFAYEKGNPRVFPNDYVFFSNFFFRLFLHERLYRILWLDFRFFRCLLCDFKHLEELQLWSVLYPRFEHLADSIPRLNVERTLPWEVTQWGTPSRDLMEPSFVCV